MARLKFGNGIQLEAQLSSDTPILASELLQTDHRSEVFQDDLKSLQDRLDTLESHLEDSFNQSEIVQPQIQHVVHNRDHSKDLNELYSVVDVLKKEQSEQKKVNTALTIVLLLTTLLHLL